MPTWFKSYLEGLPNDLSIELERWLYGAPEVSIGPDIVQEAIDVLVAERERRRKLGL